MSRNGNNFRKLMTSKPNIMRFMIPVFKITIILGLVYGMKVFYILLLG